MPELQRISNSMLSRDLYKDSIEGAIMETTYVDGSLTSIVWKDELNNVIRTDTYTYSSDSITETITELRTLASNGTTLETITVFDLDGNIISGISND